MAKKSNKKAESVVEPILLDCGKAIEGKTLKGKTFELVKSNKGILYHAYGGYNIFVTPSNTALYETLDSWIEQQDVYEKLEGQAREDFEYYVYSLTLVLNTPWFAFADEKFTLDLAKMVMDFLQKTYDDFMNLPLQEETVDEDQEFKDAVLGIEHLKEELKGE